jgi:hypothetical protein
MDSATTLKAHPEWPANTILPGPPSGWGKGSQVTNQSLPDGCYLQDANHKFINVDGTPATTNPHTGEVKKSVRPMSAAMATTEGCPDSIFSADGSSLAKYMFTPLNNLMTRPISIINADGEVFVSADTPAELYNYSHDPKVLKDYIASDAPNWLTYWSMWRTRLTSAIRDAFMQDPVLSKGVLKDAKFTMYQVQGTNGYFGNWTQTRKISTPMMNVRCSDLYVPRVKQECCLYRTHLQKKQAAGHAHFHSMSAFGSQTDT